MLNNPTVNFGNIKFLDDILKKSREEEKEKPNNKFHQIIERDKKFILNLYRSHSTYKDTIKNMEKESKGIFYYRRMVKGSLKNKSSFIRIILQSIEKVNQEKKKSQSKKRKVKFNFCKPQIDIIKKRKLELENRNQLKLIEKEKDELIQKRILSPVNIFRKKDTLSLAGKNIFENYESNVSSKKNISRINSGSENRLFSGITKNLDNISTKNKSLSRSISTNSILTRKSTSNNIQLSFPERRIKKFNYILNKCQQEIQHGNKLGGKFEKFTNIINDNLELVKQNRDNKEDNNIQDQKIIEDKVTNKQKYKLLEIEKFNELKKKIDIKISDNFVYFNRKEYEEQVKCKRKEEEYDLYLENINKINEELEKKKIKEKEKLHEIENLLEDVYKKKDYLKNKINIYGFNRIIEKDHEKYMKDNIIFDDNYFLLNEKKQEEHKGTLVQKLLFKKKENEKEKRYIIRKIKVN